MCDNCQTSIASHYGTGILGMWVTWKNSAVDVTGTVNGTTELEVDLDLRLYGAGVDSG